ncbi:hypothetical protein OHR68_12440 [Spirillospora sp. NBC_00431]
MAILTSDANRIEKYKIPNLRTLDDQRDSLIFAVPATGEPAVASRLTGLGRAVAEVSLLWGKQVIA